MRFKKPIVLVVIHTSLGELRWILPYLIQQQEHGHLEDKQVVTLFLQKNNYELAQKDKAHFDLLQSLGPVLLKKDIFRLLINNRKRIRFIFKDFWPLHAGSLVSQMYWLCPNARLVLYPHANALFSISGQVNTAKENKEKHDFTCLDSLIINSEYDMDYWSTRIPSDRINVVGSASYSLSWVKRLADAAGEVTFEAGQGQKLVLLNIRGPHEVYLTEDDYD